MSFSRFKTWLFDLDGTLIDSNAAVVSCMKQTALDMGGEVTDELELRASFGKGLMNTLKPWVPEGTVDEAVIQYQKNFPTYVQSNIQLFEGVIELLDKLESQNVPMAVVTGNKHFEAEGIYERLCIGDYFDVTICADTIPFQKPSPEPVLEALKRLGRTVDDAVFIGDSEHDIRAGNLAGVKTIAVRGGSSPEERLMDAEPDIVVDDIMEVVEALNSKF